MILHKQVWNSKPFRSTLTLSLHRAGENNNSSSKSKSWSYALQRTCAHAARGKRDKNSRPTAWQLLLQTRRPFVAPRRAVQVRSGMASALRMHSLATADHLSSLDDDWTWRALGTRQRTKLLYHDVARSKLNKVIAVAPASWPSCSGVGWLKFYLTAHD
jgi:hypothetical protein